MGMGMGTGTKSVKQYYSFFILSLPALLSSALCLAAEFNKSNKKDVRFDGKVCYIRQSRAFGLGIGALICLSTSQIIGTLFLCKCTTTNKNPKPSFSSFLLIFSWVCFGVVVILVSGATSMSRSQGVGDGWLDGECYLVRDGVYAASALLALLALGSTIGSAAVTLRAEQHRKVHAQVVEDIHDNVCNFN